MELCDLCRDREQAPPDMGGYLFLKVSRRGSNVMRKGIVLMPLMELFLRVLRRGKSLFEEAERDCLAGRRLRRDVDLRYYRVAGIALRDEIASTRRQMLLIQAKKFPGRKRRKVRVPGFHHMTHSPPLTSRISVYCIVKEQISYLE